MLLPGGRPGRQLLLPVSGRGAPVRARGSKQPGSSPTQSDAGVVGRTTTLRPRRCNPHAPGGSVWMRTLQTGLQRRQQSRTGGVLMLQPGELLLLPA